MTTTETIEVAYQDFAAKMNDIVAKNGLVTRMEVKPASYVLMVTWPEKDLTKRADHAKVIEEGTRVKYHGSLGTVTGRTNQWHHVTFDGGGSPHLCNYYGEWELEVVPENTAGGVTDKQSATPPVQHDSDDTPPMTQA